MSRINFGSTQRRDELAGMADGDLGEVALDIGWGVVAPTFGRQLATEEDAADLIAALQFDVAWINEWVDRNAHLILPSFLRNSRKRLARALEILASNDIEAEVRRANSRQGPDAYENRQSWRLLAMAVGLEDVSFWDPSTGRFVESFKVPDPEEAECIIAFHDRTIVLVTATEATKDPAFRMVWVPGKITYRVLRDY